MSKVSILAKFDDITIEDLEGDLLIGQHHSFAGALDDTIHIPRAKKEAFVKTFNEAVGPSWQTMDTAPRDGTWIIGYTGGDDLYVAIRWWDGFFPEDDDDLSMDEVPGWIVSGDNDRLADEVTHWMSFRPHPSSPPETTSIKTFDAEDGTECKSRAERGISPNLVAAKQEYYDRNSGVYQPKLWAKIAKKHGVDIGGDA